MPFLSCHAPGGGTWCPPSITPDRVFQISWNFAHTSPIIWRTNSKEKIQNGSLKIDDVIKYSQIQNRLSASPKKLTTWPRHFKEKVFIQSSSIWNTKSLYKISCPLELRFRFKLFSHVRRILRNGYLLIFQSWRFWRLPLNTQPPWLTWADLRKNFQKYLLKWICREVKKFQEVWFSE